jgi:Zn-dependent protease
MSGGNLGIYLTLVLYSLPGLVLGFTLHELAHAFAAMRLGDPTPRMQGRITADPRQHIDPLGFGLLLIVGFGWAKPVQFSTAYIRTGLQQATVAAVGPLTNLLLAILFAVAIKIQLATGADPHFETFGHGGLSDILFAVLVQSFFINVVLFVFNSLPVPGLDGYMVARGLLGGVLPDLFRWMDRNSQVVIVVAIALVFLLPQVTGGPSPLGPLIVDVNNRLYHTFVDPNSTVIGGLPSITQLFSSSL